MRYHGRDLAVVRAQRAGAVAILGSATPSLETYQNAEAGRFRLLALPERATPRPLPAVEIIDLRRHPVGPDGLLSPVLAEAVAANLAAREQTILFLNRRGFSTVVLCRACGHVVRCDHCAVSMTYHQSRGRLVCHYCARATAVPARCPACQSPKLERLGMGTERVEAVVRERFPDARVARLDRDTAGARAAGRRATACARRLASHAGRRDRHPGGHADGDQGARLRRRDAGGRAAAGPGDAPARLPRRRADVSSCSSRWRGARGAASVRAA